MDPQEEPAKAYVLIAELPYPDHNYGQKQLARQQTSPEVSDTGITRCICGMEHDDGYMICCDKCGVWQHLLCMGIDSDNIPEHYFCELCHPRPVDEHRAKIAQLKKLEEMKEDDAEDDDDDDGEQRKGTGNQKKKKQVKNKQSKVKQPGVQKRSKLKETSLPENPYPYTIAKQKWRNFYRKRYELTNESKYDQSLLESPISYTNSFTSDILKFMDDLTTATSIGKHMKALHANRNIDIGQTVIVYQGYYYSEKKFNEESSDLIGSCPFILNYSNSDKDIDICIDLRKHCNKARFIRRSCSPNCELFPAVIDSRLHVCVCATQPIKQNTEITIPFDFDINRSLYADCACDNKQCKIREQLRSRSPITSISPEKPNTSIKRPRASADEDNLDPHQQIKRKKRTSVESESTEDVEITVDVDGVSSVESATPCKPKKLSREEMKIAAIVQAFERMEKGEKKKRRESKGNEAGQSGNDDEELSVKSKKRATGSFRSRSHSRTNAASDVSEATSTTSTAPTSPSESMPFLYDDIYAVALKESRQNRIDCGISPDTEIPPSRRLLKKYQEVVTGKDNKENANNLISDMHDLSIGFGCYKKRWILIKKLEENLDAPDKATECLDQNGHHRCSPETFPIIKRRSDYKPHQAESVNPLPFKKRAYFRNLKILPKIELTASTPTTAAPSQTSSSGRRKVSLLEYRNRRINADSRRASEAGSNSATPTATLTPPSSSFNSPFFKQTGSPFEPVSPVGSPSVCGISGISFKLPQGHSRNLSGGSGGSKDLSPQP